MDATCAMLFVVDPFYVRALGGGVARWAVTDGHV